MAINNPIICVREGVGVWSVVLFICCFWRFIDYQAVVFPLREIGSCFKNTETKYKIYEIDLPPISDERQAVVVQLRLQPFVNRPRRRLLNDHLPIDSTHCWSRRSRERAREREPCLPVRPVSACLARSRRTCPSPNRLRHT